MLSLAQLPMWAISILVVFYVLISVIMILAVLIQRPQGGGLSTAFGAGAGSGQTAFGTKIGDALTIFTISVFVLFLGSSIALVYLLRPSEAPAPQPTITAPEGTPLPATGADTGGETPENSASGEGTPAGDTPPASDAPPPADTPVSSDQPAPAGEPTPTAQPATEPSGAGSPPSPGTAPDQPAGQPQTPPGR